ncbi:class I SAM-dependent methyltransferase [Parahaliea maris]|uniref:Class I SAM-dependent methyltransferase n=1 Tax=Parahaliea maris TaxID=2716870 RepID=A0A5C8ZQX0_9GAMM|nr:class I SAM-dependent methyltransferase [Parahaliea maris]TXS90858.1 class I SAM-dependent methyltransferase [Parahaliea maris]
MHIRQSRPERDQRYYQELAAGLVEIVVDLRSKLEEENAQKIKVLDVGCGKGEVLRELVENGIDCAGADIDDECVRTSSRFAPVYKANFMTLAEDLPNHDFTVVIASHVLEHVDTPKEALHQIARIGAEYLIVAVPNLGRISFTSKVPLVNRGHQMGWNAPHLRTLLEVQGGFEVLEWRRDQVFIGKFGSLPAPLSAITRFIETKLLPAVFPTQGNSLICLCKTKS